MVGSPDESLGILVVDDSATYRMILSRALKSWPQAVVVGTAADGAAALKAIEEKGPDLVLLDVSMPVLDGIETLKRLKAGGSQVDVVMCSGLDGSQTGLTMQALGLGALDFVPKPQSDNPAESFASLGASLQPLLELALQRKRQRKRLGTVAKEPSKSSLSTPSASVPPEVLLRPPVRHETSGKPNIAPAPATKVVPGKTLGVPRKLPANLEAILIGVSTGGPNALQALVPKLPRDPGCPILCVQHMPPLFTASLAERLDRSSALTVSEGAEGTVCESGFLYIAPGGRHMVVERGTDSKVRLRLNDGAPVHSCRPAVDVLFKSALDVWGGRVLTVILTGMGADGASGVAALRSKGAWSIAQDEATSVVWGMPGAVVQQGLADEILPIDQIGERITEILRKVGRR
ncbi:MAG: chemotaxis-specific protein-glutamate methyltransferase CheB [Fibrobacteria bacterium]|nr:chemotaxis-specific protein-glutamate methyltransferase CheB [Fibrobacteria bacterium]